MFQLYFFIAAWMTAATLASNSLAQRLPWSAAARVCGIDRAAGIAIAPFLLGLSIVAALGVLPGAGSMAHLAFVGTSLLALWFGGRTLPAHEVAFAKLGNRPSSLLNLVLAAIVAILAVAILVACLRSPLAENDPLEYATVARILSEAKTLTAYPVVNPETNSAGFFGPWTHPPLYVSLLYFGNIIQGLENDGISKVFSPWFTLSTALLLTAIGSLKSVRTGLVAAAIYLATPLLFRLTTIAHIDPLPMAGLTVIMAAIVGIEARPHVAGALQGTAIGMALWCHSQAVLFLPMSVAATLAYSGWRAWCPRVVQICIACAVAVLLAAWPYSRNYQIFGSIISDTPAIYALESLRWNDYFSLARGFDTLPERIQFGLLKVFQVYYFGIAYWLVVLGTAAFFVRLLLAVPLRTLRRGEMQSVPDRWLLVPITMMGVYFAGVIASFLSGNDLMLRNERYQLVTLPAASVVAAYAISIAFERLSQSAERLRLWGRSLPVTSLLAACLTIVILSFGVRSQIARLVELFSLSTDAYPTRTNTAFKLRELPPQNAVVLSLRPSDMYFTRKTMVSYLDPRLVSFYQERDVARAFDLLKALKIEYIQMPNYFLPPVYNSVLKDILADARYTEIQSDAPEGRIYRLRLNEKIETSNAIRFAGSVQCWTVINNPHSNAGRRICMPEPSVIEMWWSFKATPNSASMASGIGGNVNKADDQSSLPIIAGEEYRLDFEFSGRAYAKVSIIFYDATGRHLSRRVLGHTAALSDVEMQSLPLRFRAVPDAAAMRIVVAHEGNSHLAVNSASMSRMRPSAE